MKSTETISYKYDIECPYCHSKRLINRKNYYNKKGYGIQYKCRDCSKYFVVNKNHIKGARVLVMSDLHCGHITGLTPPQYQQDGINGGFQRESWMWFKNTIERIKPIDVLIVNGDAIDGRQEKSGGKELITGDRLTQVNMAVECINAVHAKKIYIVKGTPYHTGKEEDLENLIYEKVGAESISAHLKLLINNCLFDVRHKTGRSNIPHGRFTAMARTAMWNDLMNHTEENKANIIIRSHVHYHIYGGHSNNRIFMTTPALQGDTEYGYKECEGNVDYGVIYFDITKNGIVKDWRMLKAIFETKLNKTQVCEL